MQRFTVIFLLTIGLLGIDAFARPKRPSQLPNGNVFQCSNCHVSPGGGGTRNAFGQQVANGFLDGNGDVIWGPALAALDADQDGVTNGEELQDPTGEWAIGMANPGDVSLVSNPGDPESTVGIAVSAFALPKAFELQQNYPNPFNPSTTIEFSVPTTAIASLTIYNALGQPIRELVNEIVQPGHYSFLWDGLDSNGEPMGSGLYLARLQADGVEKTIRMLLMK